MQAHDPPVLAFGDFELDRRLCQLRERRRNEVVNIEPKVFDLLLMLIRCRDRVVPKRELLDTLWPEEVVTEGVLTRCVWAARKAVGDDGREQNVIRTLHGRGYRFVGAVQEGPGEPSDPVESGFVGRGRELSVLSEALDAARGGRRQTCLLVGGPGIGKTRTAEELAALAVRRGARVLFARGFDGEGAPPFWPWVQIVRAHCASCNDDTLRAQLGSGAADVALLWPELTERLGPLSRPPELAPAEARFRLFDCVSGFLTNASKDQPLVVVLDDLHWMDEPSLLLLRHLTRDPAGGRLLVLATYRDTELHREDPLRSALSRLAAERAVVRIDLVGMTEAEVGQLAESASEDPIPDEISRSIFDLSDGNPLFVRELARLWNGTGALPRSADLAIVPDAVREVIRRRFERLSELAADTLRSASAIGRGFAFELLERVTASEAGPAGDALLDVLHEAVEWRLIVEVPESIGSYRFEHALVRETLYAELGPIRRARLHATIGAALEELGPWDDPERLGELAFHFAEAGGSAGDERAVEYARRAAEAACALLAYEESARCYELALRALERERPPRDRSRRCELLLALVDVLWSTRAAPDTVRARVVEAVELARQLRSPALFARAALAYCGASKTGSVIRAWRSADEREIALLEEAAARLGPRDDGEQAAVLSHLSYALYAAGERIRADEVSLQAVAAARRSRRASLESISLLARIGVATGPDAVEERLALAEEVIASSGRAGSPLLELYARVFRASAMAELGRFDAAGADLRATERLADRLGQPREKLMAQQWKVNGDILAGRLDHAEEVAGLLFQDSRARNLSAGAMLVAQLNMIRCMQGRAEEVLGQLDQMLPDGGNVPEAVVLATRCIAATYAGNRPAAKAALSAMADAGFRELPRDELWLAQLAFLSETAAFLCDASRADELYGLLVPYADRVVSVSTYICVGSAARYLGELARTCARWDAALQHFDAAVETEASIGADVFLLLAQLGRAETLLARGGRGDRERVSDQFPELGNRARKLSLPPLVERAQRLGQALR